MGTKTVLNEFVAYLDLAKLPEEALGPQAPADRHLRALRFCQFWLARHLGRRAWRDGAGAPPGDHRTRLAFDRLRNDRNLHKRGDRRAPAPVGWWLPAAGENLVCTHPMVGAGDVVRNRVVDASAVTHPEPHRPTRRYAAEDGEADPCDFNRPNH